jgi:hypothetical protein
MNCKELNIDLCYRCEYYRSNKYCLLKEYFNDLNNKSKEWQKEYILHFYKVNDDREDRILFLSKVIELYFSEHQSLIDTILLLK